MLLLCMVLLLLQCTLHDGFQKRKNGTLHPAVSLITENTLKAEHINDVIFSEKNKKILELLDSKRGRVIVVQSIDHPGSAMPTADSYSMFEFFNFVYRSIIKKMNSVLQSQIDDLKFYMKRYKRYVVSGMQVEKLMNDYLKLQQEPSKSPKKDTPLIAIPQIENKIEEHHDESDLNEELSIAVTYDVDMDVPNLHPELSLKEGQYNEEDDEIKIGDETRQAFYSLDIPTTKSSSSHFINRDSLVLAFKLEVFLKDSLIYRETHQMIERHVKLYIDQFVETLQGPDELEKKAVMKMTEVYMTFLVLLHACMRASLLDQDQIRLMMKYETQAKNHVPATLYKKFIPFFSSFLLIFLSPYIFYEVNKIIP